MEGSFGRLLELLKEALVPGRSLSEPPRVIIQTHDFPDHDAVASAFGLGRLLGHYGYEALLCFRGVIRSHSLISMIQELGIKLVPVADMAGKDLLQVPCIIVDGSPVNTNARQITENLFGVVDHHPVTKNPACPFVDIRPGSGSSASIIASYWKEAGLSPGRDESTALLMGIQTDTDFLSRRVSPGDLEALSSLFFNADWEFGARVIKTSLSQRDLPVLKQAIDNGRIRRKLYFTLITVDTSQEVISILADLFLRLREITLSVIIENQGSLHHVSVRSRESDISAARIIRRALDGIGEGGGHDHMAGGLLSAALGEDTLFERFTAAIEEEERLRHERHQNDTAL